MKTYKLKTIDQVMHFLKTEKCHMRVSSPVRSDGWTVMIMRDVHDDVVGSAYDSDFANAVRKAIVAAAKHSYMDDKGQLNRIVN